MTKQIRTIAYYTVLESLRNRLFWLVGLVLVIGLALSSFLANLALTESRELQSALLAAFLRAAAVFLTATFVVTSLVREHNDKGLELLLSMSLPRSAYVLGKFAGFATMALLPGLAFGALALVLAEPADVAIWTLSLICELWLIAAFSMLCVFTFSQVMTALAAVAGFYLLARSIAAFQLIASADLGIAEAGQQWMARGLDVIAMLLPSMDRFAQSAWLVYGDAAWSNLFPVIAQTAIYLALLMAAAMFDLYRKNI